MRSIRTPAIYGVPLSIFFLLSHQSANALALAEQSAHRGEIAHGSDVLVELGVLEAGDYVIAVRQVGIDIAVTLSVDGTDENSVNTLMGRSGPEYLAFQLTASEFVSLRLSASDQAGLSGYYVATVHKMSPRERRLFLGLREVTRAGEKQTSASPADRLEAASSLERALVHFTDDGRVVLAAHTRLWLGMNYYWPARFPEATEHYHQASSMFQRLGAPKMAAIAQIELGAALMELSPERYADAHAHIESGIESLIDQGELWHAGVGMAYLGNLLEYQERYAEAISVFENSIDIFGAAGDRYRLSQAHMNRALLLSKTGRLRDARAQYSKAAEYIDINAGGQSEELLGTIMTNWADVELKLGNTAQALIRLDDASKHFPVSSDPSLVGWVQHARARVYRVAGKHALAINEQRAAVETRKKYPESYGLASALIALGEDHLRQYRLAGRASSLDMAEMQFAAAIAKAGDVTHEVNANLGLAEVWHRRNSAVLALEYLSAASDLSEQHSLTPDANARLALSHHEIAFRSSSLSLERIDAALIRMRAAEPSVHKGRLLSARAALRKTVRAALEDNGLALREFAEMRQRSGDPNLAIGLTQFEQPIIEQRMKLLLQLAEKGEVENTALLDLARSFRSRSLKEEVALNASQVALDHDEGVALAKATELLRDALAKELYSSASGLRSLGYLTAESELPDGLLSAIANFRATRARVIANNNVYRSVFAGTPAPFAEYFAEHQAIARNKKFAGIFYWVGSEFSLRWFVSADSVDMQVLPSRSELSALAARLRGMMLEGSAMPLRDFEYALASASDLLLPAGIDGSEIQSLNFSLDGPLYDIPFAALRYQAPALSSRPYLIELASIQAAQDVFPRNLMSVGSQLNEERASIGVVSATGDLALRGASLEAKVLSTKWPDQVSPLFSGTEASPIDALWRRVANHSVLHIATHAWSDETGTDLGGIELGDFSGQLVALSAWEVAQQRLDANLVFLAACDTNIGGRIPSEAPLSLSRAFHIAGAKQVIGTLWPIADAESKSVSVDFYAAYVDGGRSPRAALRLAQLERIRSGDQTRHPYFWSGYRLMAQ